MNISYVFKKLLVNYILTLNKYSYSALDNVPNYLPLPEWGLGLCSLSKQTTLPRSRLHIVAFVHCPHFAFLYYVCSVAYFTRDVALLVPPRPRYGRTGEQDILQTPALALLHHRCFEQKKPLPVTRRQLVSGGDRQ